MACIRLTEEEQIERQLAYEVQRNAAEKFGKDMAIAYPFVDNHLFVVAFDSFIQAGVCPAVRKNLDTIWDKQKKTIESYGDADYYIKKICDNERVRVLTIQDVVTCSDTDRFIVIEDNETKNVHIRVIVENSKSDYPKKEFPKKLSLKFYKDRGYNMKFLKDKQFTNLGSVYGDCRDTGYILSFGDHIHPEHSISFYDLIVHVTRILQYASNVLEEV